MSTSPKYLFMVSQKYPFGKGEVYLQRELKAFSERFEKVFLFPLDDAGGTEPRELPANVELCPLFLNRSRSADKTVFLKNFRTVNHVIKQELQHTEAKDYLKQNRREFSAQVVQALQMQQSFESAYLSDPEVAENSAFYAVWLDESALMFALMKRKNRIPDFVVRLHGYDLYDDRRPGNYMPFQGFVFAQAKRIFIVSQAGYNYLKAKGKYVDKLQVNYSGIYDHGINPQPTDQDVFTVVSCSNLVGLKRVDQIATVLNELPFAVRWVHFGDGPERKAVRKAMGAAGLHVMSELKGAVPFQEIIKFYQEQPVHAFLHLSETEGLPMAVVEAQSFGIPAIATDVGGTREIVNENTGVLIPENFDAQAVTEQLCTFVENGRSTPEYRANVKAHWKQHFHAETNYANFLQLLLG